MRRLALFTLVVGIALFIPAVRLQFPPEAATVRADPVLSGALPTDILNGDFSGEGLGHVGTPPSNYDFELSGGTVGTPPTNNGFSTGDLTGWELTGSPTIQSSGPNGDYARLAPTQAVKSSAFTVDSSADTLSVNVASNAASAHSFTISILPGPTYATPTSKSFYCFSSCTTDWALRYVDATAWRGQSVKIQVVPNSGTINVDDAGVGQVTLAGGWATTTGAGDKAALTAGGPTGSYVRSTTALISPAYTISSDGQNGSVDLKVDGSGSYRVYILSGPSFSTSNQVYEGNQNDAGSWGTRSFGLGGFAGQTVKMKVEPGPGATLLVDSMGVTDNVLPGWDSGSGTSQTGTVSALSVGNDNGRLFLENIYRAYSPSVYLDYFTPFGGTQVAWFRVCYMMHANYNPQGTDIGSTLDIWRNGAKLWQTAGKAVGPPSYDPVDVWLEDYFYVPASNGATGEFEIHGWPQAFSANAATGLYRGPDLSCLQRVDGPPGGGVPPSGITAYIPKPVGASPGDPVDAATGNFHHMKTDIAIPGRGIPLEFTRTYSALSVPQRLDGLDPLGAKWSHNWQSKLVEINSSVVTAFTPGGASYTFTGSGGTYVPPAGVEAALVKNAGGDWTLTTNDQVRYAFSSSGLLTSVTDRNGNTTSLTYNGSNQLTTITDPGGRSLTLSYTSSRITSVSDGLGRSVSYAYDSNGDLVTVTDVMGHSVTFEYAGHLLKKGTDAKGNVFVRNTYDTKNRVVSQLDAPGNQSTFAYDTPGAGATRYTDGRGKQTTYYFDQKLRITDVKDHDGGVTSRTHDSDNNVLTVTNPLGKTWTYTYDSSGNVLTATDPLNKTWTYTYNSRNDAVTVTDPLSKLTTYGYDSAGNLTSVTDANSKVTSFTVNAQGLVTAVTDPLNHSTSFGYDTYGNRTSVTNALSKTWAYAYDTKGRVTSVTDPLSHATSFTYNNANLVLTATNALSKTTTYTYDNNGNVLTVTDANNKTTTYAYNNKDQITSITDAANGAWTFAYDAVGNLTSKTNPRAKTTTYTYDNLGRLTAETDPLSHVRSYAYDASGRLTSRTSPELDDIDYTYNDRNELTRIDYPDLSYVSFTYNDAGARTQMVDSTGTTTYSYDNLYRPTSVTFPGSRTVSYGYDDAGRRTSMTYPGGTNQVAYAYDNANRLTSVTDWNLAAISYAYDDAGRMTTKTLPSGTGIVSSYSYDTADRLTGISHVQNGSTTIASVSYTLDDVGNRTQRVDQQGTHTYAYDDLYRLTSVTYPGPATTSYTFDAFGNRTSMTDASGTTDYTYDDADRLTSVDPPSASPVTYTWDDNGNLTDRGSDSFAWDYEDRMTSATVNSTTTTFVYRGDGLRDSRTTGGNTTTFTWDIAGGLPVVIDDGSQYVYGAGLEEMIAGGNTYYYLADGLGSTMAIVDDTGTVQKSYTYDVYGKPTATGSLGNEFDFAGQQTDPTGLQYLRARYMDPATGTFISREPLAGLPGWLGNYYGYAAGRPVGLTDPTGNSPAPPINSSGCDPSSSWCFALFFEQPYRSDAAYSWLEYQYRPDDIYWRTCSLVGEKTVCEEEVSDTSVLAKVDPAALWDAFMIGMTVKGISRRYTLEDGSTMSFSEKDGWYVVGRARGKGWILRNSNTGNTARIMEPNALNPRGYIRLHDAKGNLIDRYGNVNDTVHYGLKSWRRFPW